MGLIQELPELVANKIAAGEVVERPASVVKELVENAIDAQATRIEIHLEQGGKKLIRVTDDGVGMDADDVGMCFHPHATSKLKTSQDLFFITTLGFRGEALPSVGAIAQVRLVSRQAGSPSAMAIEVAGGQFTET
ncbi:MAG: ATP-binding protein, partial [Candidatus Brocadiae bacterium]|nr:ATP-binding protein [Candidatus Brocadiia bacterium]